jgi:putative ABC transport system ATP-binding protein
MISIRNIVKRFWREGIEVAALDGINLQVGKGEFMAITGPAGCGKSTLLKILGLVDIPDEGEYSFQGCDIMKMDKNKRDDVRKNNMGFVFQHSNLIDELTLYENIELPLLYLKIPALLRQRKTIEAMEKMNIAHRRHCFPKQVSELQQHSAALARAVVADPKLILFDEPAASPDLAYTDEIMKILTGLNDKGITVIMATSQRYIADYAHRSVYLFEGKIIPEKH